MYTSRYMRLNATRINSLQPASNLHRTFPYSAGYLFEWIACEYLCWKQPIIDCMFIHVTCYLLIIDKSNMWLVGNFITNELIGWIDFNQSNLWFEDDPQEIKLIPTGSRI